MDNCTLDCIEIVGNLSNVEMCHYTQEQCNQDVVQFVQAYYCLINGSFMMFILIGVPLLFLLFKALNVITEENLAPSVENFIETFKISPTLAGVTFLAFANSAPDVLTAIVAGSSDLESTALIPFGSIFGACLFSSAFILSCVIFLQPNETLTVNKKDVILPLCFYIFGVLFIVGVTTIYGKMNAYLASVLLLAYAVYIGCVLWNERKNKISQSLLESETEESEESGIENVKIENESEEATNEKSQLSQINEKSEKILSLFFSFVIPPVKIEQSSFYKTIISLAISPLVLALTQQVPDIFVAFAGPIPVFVILCLPALGLVSYSLFCKIREREINNRIIFTFYSFIVSVAALTVVCSILINFMELVQIQTGINSVFLGLTVFAWANTLGDYLSITLFAKKGNCSTAVSGIFSCQLFNFLIGFGVSLLVKSLNGSFDYLIFDFKGNAYEKISDSIVIMVIASTLLYLIYIFVTVIKQRGLFMSREGMLSRAYYVIFLCVACLLAILTDFFYEISCDL